jgi:ferrous iron transport protein B
LERKPHIALLGNPNSGKSSLFNLLTGLRQKVGNFPGVTVERKLGNIQLISKQECVVIDLPGAYSLYPRRSDEWVSYKQLMSPSSSESLDVIIVVADASNLRRNLLYVSQVIDIKIPVVVALTMTDLAKKRGITVDVDCLSWCCCCCYCRVFIVVLLLFLLLIVYCVVAVVIVVVAVDCLLCCCCCCCC